MKYTITGPGDGHILENLKQSKGFKEHFNIDLVTREYIDKDVLTGNKENVFSVSLVCGDLFAMAKAPINEKYNCFELAFSEMVNQLKTKN